MILPPPAPDPHHILQFWLIAAGGLGVRTWTVFGSFVSFEFLLWTSTALLICHVPARLSTPSIPLQLLYPITVFWLALSFGPNLPVLDQLLLLAYLSRLIGGTVQFWLQRCSLLLDMYSNRWSDHGTVWYQYRRGRYRVLRVRQSTEPLPHPFTALWLFIGMSLELLVHSPHWIQVLFQFCWNGLISTLRFGCTVLVWYLFYHWLGYNTMPSASCVFYFLHTSSMTTWLILPFTLLYRLLSFFTRRVLFRLGIFVGIWMCKELFTFFGDSLSAANAGFCLGHRVICFVFKDVGGLLQSTTDDLTSLAQDIDALLAEDATTWTFHDDFESHLAASLTTPLPRPPTVPIVTTGFRFLQKLCSFCNMHSGISIAATSSAPSFAPTNIPASFRPDKWSYVYTQKLKRWTNAAEHTIMDPLQCHPGVVASSVSGDCHPERCLVSSFLATFNPATTGMQILLAERMDRILKRSSPRSACVSVDLRDCRQIMLAQSTSWFFPTTDVSVFNSIGEGLGSPLIVDSGASCCITPHKEDFVSYHQSKVKVKDLSGVNTVAGEGMIQWRVLDKFGREVLLELKAYHIPKASVRLLSPQSLFQSIKGSDGRQDATKYIISIPDNMVLEAHYGRANLPLLPLSNSSDSCLWSKCFGFTSSDKDDWARSITASSNQNLSEAQKELLVWHFRLSHAGLSTVHNLCRHKRKEKTESPDDLVRLRDGPLLFCTHNVPDAVCSGLLCASCLAAKAKRRSPSVRPTLSQSASSMVLKRNHLHPGDCISCDHFISPVKGRAVASSGYSSTRHGYSCGTIYVDHASGYIFIRHQQSTNAAETIRGKMLLESEARHVNVRIKEYHSDNGVFSSEEFIAHCDSLGQKTSFSGVGAKFQNGVAERAIQTVCNMARASMIHAALCWPGRSFIDLWPLAMNYAAWVHNRLPPSGADGLSPEEIWSQTRCPVSHLPRAHVFGCPVYVLDPRLQEAGGGIPKWNSRVRQGIFVGFSPHHSTNVPLVYNPSTQHISPQYHVIFDDSFTTVPAITTEQQRNQLFEQLFQTTSTELLIDEDDASAVAVDNNGLSELLGDEWLTADELATRQGSNTSRGGDSTTGPLEGTIDGCSQGTLSGPLDSTPFGSSEGNGSLDGTPIVPSEGTDPGSLLDSTAAVPEGGIDSASEGVGASANVPEGEPTVTRQDPSLHRNESRPTNVSKPKASSRPSRRASTLTWKDGPTKHRSTTLTAGVTCLLALPQYALSSVTTWGQPPPLLANVGPFHHSHRPKKVQLSYLSEASLLQGDWDSVGRDACDGLSQAFVGLFEPDLSDDVGSYTITAVEPHLLQAAVHDADNPTFRQAMNSPQADQWWEAIKEEMHTLEVELNAWDLVVRTADMHVLPSKWAFKLKRFPDGLAKKFKARFCVRGDCQKEGIDFFETWSPVVQWTTVRSMMTLATKLNLYSAQADITAAFVHARLKEGERIYVHQPQGCIRRGPNGEELVYSLNRAVYGIRQGPRYFFEYFKQHLELQGLKQSSEDPCLFIGDSLIVLVYVDDVLMFSRDEADFDKLIAALRKADVNIRREGTAEGFLGVQIDRQDSADGLTITLTQSGLAKRVVEAVGLSSSMSTKIDTPAEISPLPKDADGTPAYGDFNYAAVVGMLLYLSGHSRPDIAFAVHQCARYTFNPKRKHELALIRIGRYLKGTMDKGLIMKPTSSPRLDCYPDADFAGLYGHEDSQDPHCARSRTGYVITAFGCPVLWRSKLQTEIALSTMEAEYVALSTACKDLIPMIALVKQLRRAVGLPEDVSTNLHCKIHEDNVGALTLANLEPQRMTPRSKHYAIKYHWFREYVANPANRVTIVKIATSNQLGDIFTKGLPKVTFVHLRCMLMGW